MSVVYLGSIILGETLQKDVTGKTQRAGTIYEVPDVMSWGGKQMANVHKQLGGTRVVDAMGPDPRPIHWNGKFIGPDATVRARAVDTLKDIGGQVRLSWGTFNYIVLIVEFDAIYKHEWEVYYKISCEVVRIGAPAPNPLTLPQRVQRDFTAVSQITSIPQSVQTQITSAQSAIQQVALDTTNTGQLSDAALTALQTALLSAQGAFSALSSQIATIVPVGINLDVAPANAGSVLDGFTSFMNDVASVGIESDYQIALGYLGRIIGNLALSGG